MLFVARTRWAVYRELAGHRFLYLVGIAGVILGVLGLSTDSLWAIGVGITGLILGVLGVALDARAFRSALADIDVLRDPRQRWRDLDAPVSPSTYRRITGLNDVFLVAPSAARYVQDSGTESVWEPHIPVEAAAGGWQLIHGATPPPLQAYAVLRERVRKGKILTDDPKVRIATELSEIAGARGASAVRVQRTSYFKGVLTNDLATQILTTGGVPDFDGLVSSVDPSEPATLRLANLSKSRASNHLGISVLALTSDFVLLLLLQGRRSNLGARQLVATGSGSMDWKDLRPGAGFLDMTFAAAVREMQEEFTKTPGVITSAHLLGLARCLARGGKPEICFLVRLQDTWSELQGRVTSRGRSLIRRSERPFITAFQPWDLGSAATARQRLALLRDSNAATISSSLDLALLCMLDASGSSAWDS